MSARVGKGHEFRDGPNLRLIHYPMAMRLVGAVPPSARAIKDLPLTRRQCPDLGVNRLEYLPLVAQRLVTCAGPLNCAKKIVGRYRLGQKAIRTLRWIAPWSGCRD